MFKFKFKESLKSTLLLNNSNSFSNIFKKSFLNFIKRSNLFFEDKLSYLSLEKIVSFFKFFISDKRSIIIFVIILFSSFFHLASPTFYKSEWVTNKIKEQIKDDFNIEFLFNEELKYSIFPPTFTFKYVSLKDADEKILGKIDNLKFYLSLKKFLDKEKINIDKISINNANFNFSKSNFNNLINFYNKKINEKKLSISDSRIFFKDDDDEVYSILNIKKSVSHYDIEKLSNILFFEGEIFSNYIEIDLENNFVTKNLDYKLNVPKLNLQLNNKFEYDDKKKGNLSFISSKFLPELNYEFDNKILKFNSSKKVNDFYLTEGFLNFDPFFSIININLKNIDIIKLLNLDSIFWEVLRSEIFINDNLNYKFTLKSFNVSNHNLLKNLILNVSFDQKKLNFDRSKLDFGDIASITFKDTKFNNKNSPQLDGKIEIEILNSNKLYQFFMTKKENRKKIKTINLDFQYYFFSNSFKIENLIFENHKNEKVEVDARKFNSENKFFRKRVEFQNYFNTIVSNL